MRAGTSAALLFAIFGLSCDYSHKQSQTSPEQQNPPSQTKPNQDTARFRAEIQNVYDSLNSDTPEIVRESDERTHEDLFSPDLDLSHFGSIPRRGPANAGGSFSWPEPGA